MAVVQSLEEDNASRERLAGIIVDSGLRVHRTLGPGLLETAYEHCLGYELKLRGLRIGRQVALPVVYDDTKLDVGYRIDILLEDTIIIELKAVDVLTRLQESQVLTYLKPSGHRLGFLMIFNVELFNHGLKRLVL